MGGFPTLAAVDLLNDFEPLGLLAGEININLYGQWVSCNQSTWDRQDFCNHFACMQWLWACNSLAFMGLTDVLNMLFCRISLYHLRQ